MTSQQKTWVTRCGSLTLQLSRMHIALGIPFAAYILVLNHL